MTVTPTLSLRPDAVVLRWIDRLQLWWQTVRASDIHLFEDLRELDARTLRDIGLEHLVATGRR
jgi:hypothetical protein